MKRIWEWINKYKVVSGIISGIVVLLIGKKIDSIFSLEIYSSVWEFLDRSRSMPLWGLILVAILPIIILRVYKRIKEPKWKSYTSDIIDGIKWTWEYMGNDNYPHSLTPRCPKCSRELLFSATEDYRIIPQFAARCNNCNFLQNFQGEIRNLEEGAGREIDAKLLTKEYLKLI